MIFYAKGCRVKLSEAIKANDPEATAKAVKRAKNNDR